MNPFVHYITSWYTDPDARRHAEQSRALATQVADPFVATHVALSMDEGCPVGHVLLRSRPTFADLMAWGRRNAGAVNLILNTDCHLDPACTPLLETVAPGEIWCLSRQDNLNKTSQDAWAWRGQLPPEVGQGYCPGTLGCDNRLAYQAAASGWRVLNPSLSVRVIHLHSSGVRRWKCHERLPRPYLFVEPTRLGEPPRYAFEGDEADKARIQGVCCGL